MKSIDTIKTLVNRQGNGKSLERTKTHVKLQGNEIVNSIKKNKTYKSYKVTEDHFLKILVFFYMMIRCISAL